MEWRVAAIFASVAALGAFAGGRFAAWLPGDLLLLVFSLTMVAVATGMLRAGRRSANTTAAFDGSDREAGGASIRPASLLAAALPVGAYTGAIGAGGGFLIVPALHLFAGLPLRRATATSLVVIGINAIAGVAGHAAHTSIFQPEAFAFTLAACAGMVAGIPIQGRMSDQRLRQGFAVLVLAVGCVQLMSVAWPFSGGRAAAGIAALFAIRIVAALPAARRRRAGPSAPTRFPRRAGPVPGRARSSIVLAMAGLIPLMRVDETAARRADTPSGRAATMPATPPALGIAAGIEPPNRRGDR